MTEPMYMLLPKKSWSLPAKSKSMKAEYSESDLQEYANRMIEDREWKQIRFPDSFLAWMKEKAPQDVRKVFFGQVGGKMPDNLIMVPLGPGMFFAVTMELKTQDRQGRAVGKLHGKQKKTARIDGWYVARSMEQIDALLKKISDVSVLLKINVVTGGKVAKFFDKEKRAGIE